VFTNDADFNAAVAAAGLTLGFEALTSGPKPSPLDVGPFTLTVPAPFPIAITQNVNFATHGVNAVAVTPGFQPMIFTFDSAIRAFSMDVVDGFNTAGGTLFGRVGNGAEQTFFTGGGPGVGARTFLGILDLDAAFTTLQFSGEGGFASSGLDRVQFDTSGGNPTPVRNPPR
jgi:hypothetical protein